MPLRWHPRCLQGGDEQVHLKSQFLLAVITYYRFCFSPTGCLFMNLLPSMLITLTFDTSIMNLDVFVRARTGVSENGAIHGYITLGLVSTSEMMMYQFSIPNTKVRIPRGQAISVCVLKYSSVGREIDSVWKTFFSLSLLELNSTFPIPQPPLFSEIDPLISVSLYFSIREKRFST